MAREAKENERCRSVGTSCIGSAWRGCAVCDRDCDLRRTGPSCFREGGKNRIPSGFETTSSR